jgi:hypothetical protein
VGWSFFVGGAIVHLPTRVTGRWRELPLGSPEGWAAGYALLGRPGKAELLFAWLEAHGADAGAVAQLLGQPLPPALEDRLVALTR